MARFTGYYRPKAQKDPGYIASNLPLYGNFTRAKEEARKWNDYKKRFPGVEKRGGILYPTTRYGRSLKAGIYETMGVMSRVSGMAKKIYR